jgi:hypothetical protein
VAIISTRAENGFLGLCNVKIANRTSLSHRFRKKPHFHKKWCPTVWPFDGRYFGTGSAIHRDSPEKPRGSIRLGTGTGVSHTVVLTGSEKVRSDVILRVVWYDHLPHLGRTRQDALQHIIPRRILHRTGEKFLKFFFFRHSTILRQNNASYLW